MNFSPWLCKPDRRTARPDSAWKAVRTLNRKAERAGKRELVEIGVDLFEAWDGPICNRHDDRTLMTCPLCGKVDNTTSGEGHSEQGDDLWDCSGCGKEVTLRVATLSDLLRDVFALVDSCPWLDFVAETKFPERVKECWPTCDCHRREDYGERHLSSCPARCRKNIFIGVPVSTQADADRLLPELLKLHDLSPVLFVHARPVEKIILHKYFARCQCGGLHGFTACPNTGGVSKTCERTGCTSLRPLLAWLRASGEVGPNARPAHPDWMRSLRDQAKAAGVPFSFEGWGEWVHLTQSLDCMATRDIGLNPGFYTFKCESCKSAEASGRIYASVGCECRSVYKFGSRLSGRLLDGQEHNERPEVRK